MPPPAFDPLAALRRDGDPEVDVFVWGTVFLDIIMTGLETLPDRRRGGLGRRHGLVPRRHRQPRRRRPPTRPAHLARGRLRRRRLRRLLLGHPRGRGGRRPQPLAPLRRLALPGHRVDGRGPRPRDGQPRPRAAGRGHRAHRGAAPLARGDGRARSRPPSARRRRPHLGREGPGRTERSSSPTSAGTPAARWPREVLDQLTVCDAFLPNAVEAMAYTRTRTPTEALYVLADLVPLAVVTNGEDGALAIDSRTGEEAVVPALRVDALDPTGAGDVFGAAVVARHARGLASAAADRLRLPVLRARRAALRRLARRTGLGRHRRLVAPPARRRRPPTATTGRCGAGTPSSTTSSRTSRSGAGRRATATIARHVDVEGFPPADALHRGAPA